MQANDFWDNVIKKKPNPNWAEIAKSIGIKHQTLWAMYTNKTFPKVDIAYKLSKFLDCSLEYLLFGSENNLSFNEQELVDNYRRVPTFIKVVVEETLKANSRKIGKSGS